MRNIIWGCVLIITSAAFYILGYRIAESIGPIPVFTSSADGREKWSLPVECLTNNWSLKIDYLSSDNVLYGKAFILHDFPEATHVTDKSGTDIFAADRNGDGVFDLVGILRSSTGALYRSLIDFDLDGQCDSRSDRTKRQIRIGTTWHDVVMSNKKEFVSTSRGLRESHFSNGTHEVSR